MLYEIFFSVNKSIIRELNTLFIVVMNMEEISTVWLAFNEFSETSRKFSYIPTNSLSKNVIRISLRSIITL